MPFSVTLRVYDLSQGILPIPVPLHPLSSTSAGMAAQMSLPLLGRRIDGIWHTSIIVYNREWQYSGGIVSGIPQPTLMGMRPSRTHDLGQTEIPLELFQEFVRDMRPRFTQQT